MLRLSPRRIHAELVNKGRNPHGDPQTLTDLAPDASAEVRGCVLPVPLWG